MKKLKELCQDFNILLVDDEKKELNNFKRILDHIFKSVSTAHDGISALKKYKNNVYDLVITDVIMPVMDGFELIKEIKKINFNQRIIILSGSNGNSFLHKAITYNLDGYIFKPLKIDQMADAIKRAVKIIILEKQHKEYQYNLEKKVNEQVLEIEKYSKKFINQLLYSKNTNLPNKKKLQLDFNKKIFKEFILVDIDNFGNINLAYGFENGNKIIRLIAKYLSDLSKDNLVYYISADEFIIGVKIDSKESATDIANNIKEDVYSTSFQLSNTSIRLTFTFGIVELKDEMIVPYNKLHTAVKEIRQISKNSIGYYYDNSPIIEKQKSIQECSQKIKLALDCDWLKPFYQPIYDLKKEKIVKYECLVRIVDGKQIISPFKFLEAAKISGFLSNITRRVIDKAFEYFSETNHVFSINITDDDLKENYLKEYLELSCQKYNISPANVIMEVLESISDYDATHAIMQLKELSDAGFKISIDDFGADNSNFGRVQKLSVDFLKIDGSFIKDIDTNQNSLDITKTIVYYAKRRGLQTIAEFVHSKEIFDIVKTLDIDFVQGYYIGEPKEFILNTTTL